MVELLMAIDITVTCPDCKTTKDKVDPKAAFKEGIGGCPTCGSEVNIKVDVTAPKNAGNFKENK